MTLGVGTLTNNGGAAKHPTAVGQLDVGDYE